MQAQPLQPEAGASHVSADLVRRSISRCEDLHTPVTMGVALENTLWGQVQAEADLQAVCDVGERFMDVHSRCHDRRDL